jgi:thiamine-monophosphate kinase
LAVNLSDLAAMGAVPAWSLLALTLPTAWTPAARNAFVEGFADGFVALAREHRVALVGGDTTGGPLAMSVTVHGFVPPGQALRRAAAQVGDAILVTGTLGDAVAALHLLRRGEARVDDAALLARMHRPVPRVAAGLALRGRVHACQDISDGLLADLGHVCTASGVGAEIEVDAIRRDLREIGGATRIGRIVAGDCVTARDAQGRVVEPAHRGWDHFAS